MLTAFNSLEDKLAHINIRLHKLASNSAKVVRHFPLTELNEEYQAASDIICGVLGFKWSTVDDVFMFKVYLPEREFTPRGVNSINHTVFDCLGLLSPVLLQGKLLQRTMFESRKNCPKGMAPNWDEPLDSSFLPKWSEYQTSLQELESVSFPRSYYPADLLPIERVELHAFADSSLVAMGFAIYIRVLGNGRAHSTLAFAGSRLAPRSVISIV